ncbi:MAG: ATP-dependent zinc metalloprotease FtsH [Planctomycetales bacterium]|nr:ATP-dependent zinc metalloprotease FtsH [Planctomycetales bacterium]
MSQQDSNQRRPDGKNANYNFIVLAIVCTILALLIAIFLTSPKDNVLRQTELRDLIEAIRDQRNKGKTTPIAPQDTAAEIESDSATDETPDQPSDTNVTTDDSAVVAKNDSTTNVPFIEVTRGRVRVRYSKLRNVQLQDRAIRGTLTRQDISGSPNTAPYDVEFRSYTSGNVVDDAELYALLREAGISYGSQPGPSVWRTYAPMFVITALFLLFFFFMLRRLGGAGSPMAFGRSRGKLYAQEDLGVTFTDVAGIDEAVEEVNEVVDFLKSPEKYQKLGGRIPKGVLLVGPPGTGKTLLAKAIAGEAGVPFYSLSGSDFVEMFVGVGAAHVRDMFQQAEAKAPCIIFIDELDALGKSRGTGNIGGHDEREQTLNALLVEMDGFGSNNGVIVVAATNRPEMLDQALLRPGRFDRQVLVDRPDIRGREDILKVHIKNVRLDETVSLKDVAAISPGFVGADLANLVNEATLLAARKDKHNVGMEEFNEGVERVTAGLEKKQRVMNDDEKYRVAYHESGHALVAFSLPNTDPVHKVSIIPRGVAALGYVMQRPEGDRFLLTQPELESRIQVCLAGTVAEELIFSDVSTGAKNDLERSTEIARSMVMDYGMSELGRINYRNSSESMFLATGPEDRMAGLSEETARNIDTAVRRIVEECLAKVREILNTRRTALVALAEELMKVESINADRLKQIIEESSPGPLVVPGTRRDKSDKIPPSEDESADATQVGG